VNSNIFHRVACFFWCKKKNLKPTNLLKVSAAPWPPPMTPWPPRDLCLEEFSDQDFESCPQAAFQNLQPPNPPGWDSILKQNPPKIDILNLQMDGRWKMIFVFNWMIFWFHLNLLQGLYWLVHKDPYTGFLQSLKNWVVIPIHTANNQGFWWLLNVNH